MNWTFQLASWIQCISAVLIIILVMVDRSPLATLHAGGSQSLFGAKGSNQFFSKMLWSSIFLLFFSTLWCGKGFSMTGGKQGSTHTIVLDKKAEVVKR